MSNTSRMTSKGQVTIPQKIREKLKLLPQSEVEFELKNGFALVRKARHSTRAQTRGKGLVEHLRGKGSVPLTTDEILALIRK